MRFRYLLIPAVASMLPTLAAAQTMPPMPRLVGGDSRTERQPPFATGLHPMDGAIRALNLNRAHDFSVWIPGVPPESRLQRAIHREHRIERDDPMHTRDVLARQYRLDRIQEQEWEAARLRGLLPVAESRREGTSERLRQTEPGTATPSATPAPSMQRQLRTTDALRPRGASPAESSRSPYGRYSSEGNWLPSEGSRDTHNPYNFHPTITAPRQ
jgi:hypothetical protein